MFLVCCGCVQRSACVVATNPPYSHHYFLRCRPCKGLTMPKNKTPAKPQQVDRFPFFSAHHFSFFPFIAIRCTRYVALLFLFQFPAHFCDPRAFTVPYLSRLSSSLMLSSQFAGPLFALRSQFHLAPRCPFSYFFLALRSRYECQLTRDSHLC